MIKKYSLTRIFSAVFLLTALFISPEVRAQSADTVGAPIVMDEFSEGREQMGTYVINPLDRLNVVVYAGDKQIESTDEIVRSDGTIYLPYLERDVKIGGLRILDAEEVLERLSRKYLKEPRIVMTVVRSYSQTVSTYGEIQSMDVEIMNPIRILQLIAKAGGPETNARSDSIRVISLDGSIKYFNFDEVNKTPTDEANFYLKPGDIVFVPEEEDFRVTALGEVRNPGEYGMKSGNKLLDAIVSAGSWTESADISKIKIIRDVDGKKVTVETINFEKYLDDGEVAMNLPLQDGDIVHVSTKKTSVFVSQFGNLMRVLYTMATLYAVVISIQN